MSHSTWIALSLAALFLVYVTMRGHLPDYLATVLGPFPAKETGSDPGSTGDAPQSPNVFTDPWGVFKKGLGRIFGTEPWN